MINKIIYTFPLFIIVTVGTESTKSRQRDRDTASGGGRQNKPDQVGGDAAGDEDEAARTRAGAGQTHARPDRRV